MLSEQHKLPNSGVLPTAQIGDPPDWRCIPFDVPCRRCGEPVNGALEPKCDYCGAVFKWVDVLPLDDLRCRYCRYPALGLSVQRCPECGESFTWDEILEAACRRRSLVFEHLPRHRRFDTLGRTWLLAAFRPGKLWQQYDRYALVTVAPLLLFVSLQWFAFAYGWDAIGWPAQRGMNAFSRLIGSKFTFQYYFRVGPRFLPFMASWYVATFFSLQVFYLSKRRYDVNWSQSLRVYVHATAFVAILPGVWCVLEMLLDSSLFIAPTLNRWLNRSSPSPYLVLRTAVFMLGVVGTWLHIWFGYARYLNHPRGWGVAAFSIILGYNLARLLLFYV